MSTLQELKQEADSLGVSYAKNVTAERLAEKIEEFYTAQETSGPALQEAVKQVEKEKDQPAQKVDTAKNNKRLEREQAARKTHVITIIDNDQRVNNQTTTCTVNCSNEYFDLGTVVLPLNEKIEVATGHIKTLEQVKIPLHVRDNKTGLSTVRMRPRYTISYENV